MMASSSATTTRIMLIKVAYGFDSGKYAIA
jgi:hypothetical protein